VFLSLRHGRQRLPVVRGQLSAWISIPLSALFASLLHELEHELIHRLYFRNRRWVQNLMMLTVWIMRPSTIHPWYRPVPAGHSLPAPPCLRHAPGPRRAAGGQRHCQPAATGYGDGGQLSGHSAAGARYDDLSTFPSCNRYLPTGA
jgi:hypothetical protein